MHVLNSFFSGNSATTGSGGAIYILGEALKIVDTTFSCNNARGAGVLALMDLRETLLNGSTFVDNFALATGTINASNSVFVAINSLFNGNVAGQLSEGGCLVFAYGKISLENCTLSNNINQANFGSGRGGAIKSDECELRISTSIFDSNEAVRGKDIFLNNDLLTYLTIFKYSVTYRSNDENFKDKVFQDNIFFSNHPNDVIVSESQYASSKNSLFPKQN